VLYRNACLVGKIYLCYNVNDSVEIGFAWFCGVEPRECHLSWEEVLSLKREIRLHRNGDYQKLYAKIFRVMGELTPLRVDCGVLCGGACCKGDDTVGMRLFPGEETILAVKPTEVGGRLAVCDGSCDRQNRPLACRIFPFFPTIDDKGHIFVEKDYRAALLCPLIEHSDEIVFDPRFFKAVKKVGKLLANEEACRMFLYETTEEIDMYGAWFSNKE